MFADYDMQEGRRGICAGITRLIIIVIEIIIIIINQRRRREREGRTRNRKIED